MTFYHICIFKDSNIQISIFIFQNTKFTGCKFRFLNLNLLTFAYKYSYLQIERSNRFLFLNVKKCKREFQVSEISMVE